MFRNSLIPMSFFCGFPISVFEPGRKVGSWHFHKKKNWLWVLLHQSGCVIVGANFICMSSQTDQLASLWLVKSLCLTHYWPLYICQEAPVSPHTLGNPEKFGSGNCRNAIERKSLREVRLSNLFWNGVFLAACLLSYQDKNNHYVLIISGMNIFVLIKRYKVFLC